MAPATILLDKYDEARVFYSRDNSSPLLGANARSEEWGSFDPVYPSQEMSLFGCDVLVFIPAGINFQESIVEFFLF